MRQNKLLMEKVYESVASVLPITAIVLLLSITIAPLPPGTLVLFCLGPCCLSLAWAFLRAGPDSDSAGAGGLYPCIL